MSQSVTNPAQELSWFVSKKEDFAVTCGDATFLVMSIALVIFGILFITGVLPMGRQGFLLPGISFGANVEGGFCLGIGALVGVMILGRIFSPRFREVCTPPQREFQPTPVSKASPAVVQ